MPRMRGRLYSSCASSTWSLPSALDACWAKMSRISCVRSTTRASSASSSERCCVGLELVVDEQHLRRRRRVRRFSSSSLPLPTNVRGSGRAAVLDELADGRDARGARELAELARARRRRPTPFGKTPTRNPRSGSAPGAGSGWRAVTAGLCPGTLAAGDRARRSSRRADARARRHPLREPAARTAIREHLLELVPPGFAPEYAGDEAFLFAAAATAERRSSCSRPLRHRARAGQPPGRIDDGAVHGLGASDMKGGLAVAVELVRDLEPREPGLVRRRRCSSSDARSCRPSTTRSPRSSTARCSSTRRLSRSCSSRPTSTIQAGCLGNVIARAHLSRRRAATRHGRGWRTTRSSARSRASRRCSSSSLATAIVDGLDVPRGRLASRGSRRESPTTSSPDGAVATLNFRYPPDRTPARPRRTSRSLVPAGATLEIVGNSPPAASSTDAPLVRALRRAGDLDVEPKQAWTNVADFTTRGLDAVNFGPGHTALAHSRDEHVDDRRARHRVRGAAALPARARSEKMARDGSRAAHRRALGGGRDSTRRAVEEAIAAARSRRGARRRARGRTAGSSTSG